MRKFNVKYGSTDMSDVFNALIIPDIMDIEEVKLIALPILTSYLYHYHSKSVMDLIVKEIQEGIDSSKKVLRDKVINNILNERD